MSMFGSDAHQRVARMVGYALTRGTSEGWLDAAAVFAARLTEQERAGLAYAALRSLDDDNRVKVAETAVGSAGAPLPAFLKPMDDAGWWASQANVYELKSYLWAAFHTLPARAQADFLDKISGRAAA